MSPVFKKIIHITSIVVVIAVAVIIFVFRDSINDLGNYGYLGVFLISLISCATIILPVPGMLLIIAIGAVFNPVLVGIVAAIGGTMGEGVGYILGRNGRSLVPGKKIFARMERWMKKWGAITIFVSSLVPPLPIDLVGITAGSLRYPAWRFFFTCFLGKAILYTGMAFAGAWGWEWVLQYFGL